MTNHATANTALKRAENIEFRAATEADLEKDVREINVRFEKATKLEGQADDHRLAASILLAAAKERCREAEINFKEWCNQNIKQSYETIRKLIPIGVAESKEVGKGKLLLADMRTANAQRNKKHRAHKKDGDDAQIEWGVEKKLSKHKRNNERNDPVGAHLRTARDNARKRGLEFSIERSDLPEIMPQTCAVLGVSLRLDGPNNDDYAPSLDRIDNSRGYIPGNVAFVSRRANRLKGDATQEELQKLADFYSKVPCTPTDGPKQMWLGKEIHAPSYVPKPILAEPPDSIKERGAVTYAILHAFSPDLTVYEVAKSARMLDNMGDVRRTLAYHQRKCISMRERIDNLVELLERNFSTGGLR